VEFVIDNNLDRIWWSFLGLSARSNGWAMKKPTFHHNQTSTLRTRTEMVFETLAFSPLNHLTLLIARENFIILSRRESNKSHLIWTGFLRYTGVWITQCYRAGLRAGWSGVRVPAGSGNFSLHRRVQTSAGAHPTSYLRGIGGSFLGVKQPGREANHPPPSSAEVKKVCGAMPALPHYAFMACCTFRKAQGQIYHFTLPF
jgi:hypothetical protein